VSDFGEPWAFREPGPHPRLAKSAQPGHPRRHPRLTHHEACPKATKAHCSFEAIGKPGGEFRFLQPPGRQGIHCHYNLGIVCVILKRRGHRSNYRLEECPVIDAESGVIDYAPPEPKDLARLMATMIEWLQSKEAGLLPGPVRAGIMAHRFVSIHPFSDGNGRTARALATTELWRSGYDLRGFLSLEEYYTADLSAYYRSLQMGLPVNFYEGRHDPDHTTWLEYFVGTMARGSKAIREKAVMLYQDSARSRARPWENLKRVQQQLLTRLLVVAVSNPTNDVSFTPTDISEWYGISPNPAREWLEDWRSDGFVCP
jgi:cell filamentation protein, protein adenylyltransferase